MAGITPSGLARMRGVTRCWLARAIARLCGFWLCVGLDAWMRQWGDPLGIDLDIKSTHITAVATRAMARCC